MRILNLDHLKNGCSGITPTVASYLVEAAVIFLIHNGHQSGVILNVSGAFNEQFKLIWSHQVDANIIRNWKDFKETTEYGATAIAIHLLFSLTDFRVLERSPQYGKGDYYLRTDKQNKKVGFVEISGILKETTGNTINARVNKKVKNIKNKGKPTQQLEMFTIVTEFGKPKTKIYKK